MQEKQKRTDSEVCIVRIMFPAVSDEQAIECKKKISEVLADIADVRIDFSLSRMRNGMELQPANR